jgi:hypothetical protein
MRLQRISFGRSDIPPSVKRDDCRGGLLSVRVGQWRAWFDFELRVLRTTEHNLQTAFDRMGGDAPAPAISDEDEEEFAERRVEPLDQAAPALVAAARADVHAPAVEPEGRAGLHLHPNQPLPELGDEVAVRAVAGREVDPRPFGREPLHRR